ncbi:jg8805 [Pararge aegeria aegeria]|uniref:Jg8805 protein n=1 Tax=Pararge aegeria aegeria TaxID=348720 RepID=A0A8S4S6N1_9NEOP|nr:jg8805 [Pararge aegeria aegeria]
MGGAHSSDGRSGPGCCNVYSTPENAALVNLQSTAGLKASLNVCPKSPSWADELVIAVDRSRWCYYTKSPRTTPAVRGAVMTFVTTAPFTAILFLIFRHHTATKPVGNFVTEFIPVGTLFRKWKQANEYCLERRTLGSNVSSNRSHGERNAIKDDHLEGRREEGSRFELDPHISMSREVEDDEGGLHQFGQKSLKKTKKVSEIIAYK